MHTITVRDLFIYPVKSARGIAVDEATVTDRGFENDRRFMVVDEESRFLTQRKYPQMALIDVRIERGGSAGAARLVLEAPDAGGIAVPLRPEGGERRTVEVWDDRCEALSMGPDARRFFERILGIPGDLVYMPDETARLANPAYSTPGAKVSFVDAYSYLVIAEASLGELNAHLKEPVPMNRFRPNIVIEGCEPYAEDGFRAVSIGDYVLTGGELPALIWRRFMLKAHEGLPVRSFLSEEGDEPVQVDDRTVFYSGLAAEFADLEAMAQQDPAP